MPIQGYLPSNLFNFMLKKELAFCSKVIFSVNLGSSDWNVVEAPFSENAKSSGSREYLQVMS